MKTTRTKAANYTTRSSGKGVFAYERRFETFEEAWRDHRRSGRDLYAIDPKGRRILVAKAGRR